jgi:aspartate ammonia-lyase
MGFQFLKEEIISLSESFDAIAKRHADLLKIGRTHLETAVPMTVGQEFKAYASTLRTLLKTVQESEKSLSILGIGGTAIGTGINTLPGFSKAMVSNLSKLSGFKLKLAPNFMETTRGHSALLKASSSLRAVAAELQSIANDIRILSSSILNEINIPEVEPGSSIMPGKVNPSTPECLNMICCQVMGNDHTVSLGAQNGQLQLNWHTPIIMWNILQSTQILTYGIAMFREDCVDDIHVNEAKVSGNFNSSLVTATALAPTLGYYKVAALVKEAAASGQPLRDVVASKKLMPEKTLDRLLSPGKMVKPGLIDQKLIKKLKKT